MTIRTTLLAVFLLALAAAPLVLPEYYVTLLNYIGLGSLATLGIVLLTGIGGLTSFGQAAFVGIGAYATAYATTAWGFSPWFALPLGLFAAAACALAIGAVTLRLSGHYLPLSTIAWSLSLYYLVGNLPVLGAHDGITGLPAVSLFGVVLDDARSFSFLIWIFVLLGLLSVHNLLGSRAGRAIRCLRGRSTMAEAFGVDTTRLKVAIFVHAALLAAASGWLYAHLVRFVNPTPFGLNVGIEYLFMAVVGGVGQLAGAVVGAGVMVVLRDVLQDVAARVLGVSGAIEIVAYGVLIIVLLQNARAGIVPFVTRRLPAPEPLKVPDDAPSLPMRDRPARGETVLVADKVVRRFGGLVAVNEVSFTLKAGEILGVIGPNGAGKSTLFNLLSGVLPLTGGAISVLGRAANGLTSRAIARLGLARTFQHVQLRGDMSVLENVALGAHMRSRKGILSAILRLDRKEEGALLAEALRQLERVGLADSRNVPAGSLALGQQRIVEIARALASDPVVLLLDEPAAGLRYHEKQALAALLDSLRAEGMSILIVEHDMDFVMNLVDRLVVMEFGRPIASGVPGAVQNDPAVLEAYLGGAV
ncbi:ATP-binding cassette domain-containing protein [Pseudochelatococcus lubricantis]|uniref:branched-chain amino acid ABC transporter ATP-binding protein/permease n=1 Tax=Pseudochelatococcus lubricantis TaxID=1538102 RepID=UPI0035E8AF7B